MSLFVPVRYASLACDPLSRDRAEPGRKKTNIFRPKIQEQLPSI
ncbi:MULTISPECIES: hypothetical protein [unclassified Microcoleus]